MIHFRPKLAAAALLTVAIVAGIRPATGQEPDQLPPIDEFIAGMDRTEGLLPVVWDDAAGKVYLEIDEGGDPVLYRPILAGGLGSNDVGLDRGLFDEGKIVRFERVGRQVLLFQDNLAFRATSANPDERLAVGDAFARSILHGFEVKAQSDGRVLVDATPFVVRDALGIPESLKDAGQGEFSMDASRSAPNPDVLKSFPDNVELEAWLTFAGDDPGRFVREVSPDPGFVTLRIRHSFVRLPDDGYVPREFDPRSGFFGISFVDYSTPVSAQKERRFIARHRVDVEDGRAVEPLVYYLDRGTPEPIRSALLEGARWWAEAFEAAGIRDAFRVEVLPSEADPMDVRYNIIQWVHRSTRGWSWGGSLIDPRTGEILKGHVALGSLRVRQDYLLALGMAGLRPELATGDTAAGPDPLLEMALARIRQLSAHEVGHTLGLDHNFAASVSDRASVMDYPAPFVTLGEDGQVNLGGAYAVGIGEWDKTAIRYGYSVFGSDDEERGGLKRILEDARASGLQYISDEGARPIGGAHPAAHLWDNGENVLDALRLDMEVRQAALARFGPAVLDEGQPLAVLEEVLVPLYLRHRYQIEAAAKLVGGVWYEYAVAGSEWEMPERVEPELQRDALSALLSVLQPAELELPETASALIPPRPPGFGQHRELFGGDTGLTFDPYAPASSLADFVFRLLTDPARAARLHYQSIMEPAAPGFVNVLTEVSSFTRQRDQADTPKHAEIRRQVEAAWVRALIRSGDEYRNPSTAAAVLSELSRLRDDFEARSSGLETKGSDAEVGDAEVGNAEVGDAEARHAKWLADVIRRFMDRPLESSEKRWEDPLPPGSPIGQ